MWNSVHSSTRYSLHFREVQDNQWHQYLRLEAYLNGRGTPDLEETWKEVLLQPLHRAFKELFNPALIHRVIDAQRSLRYRETGGRSHPPPPSFLEGGGNHLFPPLLAGEHPCLTPSPLAGEGEGGGTLQNLLNEMEQKAVNFLVKAKQHSGESGDETAALKEIRNKLKTVLQLSTISDRYPWTVTSEKKTAPEYLQENLKNTPLIWGTLLGWLFVHALGKLASPKNVAEQSLIWIDEWRLDKIIVNGLLDLKVEEPTAKRLVALIKLLTRHQRWFEVGRSERSQTYQVLDSLLRDDDIQKFVNVNRYDNILWFNKEAFEELLAWLMLIAVVNRGSNPLLSPTEIVKEIGKYYEMIQEIGEAQARSDYQVDKLLIRVKHE